jgi:diguanylate cyclase (GGDEF)-like protein
VLWSVVAWFAVERHLQDRIAASAVQQTNEIRQELALISANLDGMLNRLQGMAVVLAGGSDVRSVLASFGAGARPSPLAYEARKAEWTARADLLAASQHLLATTKEIGADVVWAMNAGGDCVAASNVATGTSFVGTNYADRSYFSSAQAGTRGHQYAVGRITNVPGLFFSAPVIADGRFLGAVAVKSDLPRIAAAIDHPSAFVTDDQGVIILAADHSREMRALPGAAVNRLSGEQRLSRYLRLQFDTQDVGTRSGPGELVRLAGSPDPHISVRNELSQHGITVHIVVPVKNLDGLRRDALVAFLLLALSGILLNALAFGSRAYLLRTRQYRQGMEAPATNPCAGSTSSSRASPGSMPLTGLYNRRFMDEFLEREVARMHRKQLPLAVIVIDIDHFKRFNDAFGHAGGDAMLCAASELVRRHMRKSDVVCRYGGGEFFIVMPEATLEAARQRAGALLLALRDLKVSHEGKTLGKITVSLGLAALPQHGDRRQPLFSAAGRDALRGKKTRSRPASSSAARSVSRQSHECGRQSDARRAGPVEREAADALPLAALGRARSEPCFQRRQHILLLSEDTGRGALEIREKRHQRRPRSGFADSLA